MTDKEAANSYSDEIEKLVPKCTRFRNEKFSLLDCDIENRKDGFIASGTFGAVFQKKYQGLQTVAIKYFQVSCYRLSDVEIKELCSEVVVLMEARHENIICFYGVILEPRHHGIVMEFAKYGNLESVQKKLKDGAVARIPWPLLVRLMRDTTAGLAFLHMKVPDRKIILHNDIKPSNVMVTDQLRAKIGDFGLSKIRTWHSRVSKIHQPDNTSKLAGTLIYLAPERILNIFIPSTTATDVFSFGMTLFEMVLGKSMFDDCDVEFNHLQHGYKDKNPFPFHWMTPLIDCPCVLKEITIKSMSYDPEERPEFYKLRMQLDSEVTKIGLQAMRKAEDLVYHEVDPQHLVSPQEQPSANDSIDFNNVVPSSTSARRIQDDLIPKDGGTLSSSPLPETSRTQKNNNASSEPSRAPPNAYVSTNKKDTKDAVAREENVPLEDDSVPEQKRHVDLKSLQKELRETEDFIRSSQRSVTTLTPRTISEMRHRIELLNKDKEILTLQNELAKHERNNLGQRIGNMEETIVELSKQLGGVNIQDTPPAVPAQVHHAVGPLQTLLQSNYVALSQSLYADSVLPYLYQERVFSPEENEDITDIIGQRKKAKALLNCLRHKDDKAVKVLVNALKETDQDHLATYFNV